MADTEFQAEGERAKAILFRRLVLAGSLLLIPVLWLATAWPMAQLFEPWSRTPRAAGLSQAWWNDTKAYLGALLIAPGPWAKAWLPVLWHRFVETPVAAYHIPSLHLAWQPALVTLLAAQLYRSCPWDIRPKSQGSAKWSTIEDLKSARLFAPTGLILGRLPVVQTSTPPGRWSKRGRRQRDFVRNWETLSGILISPPGTGKTVQLMTQLLADWPDRIRRRLLGFIPFGSRPAPVPGPSMIVNDPKGEIFQATSAHRSKIGPVIRLAWADTAPEGHNWNPLDPSNFPGGEKVLLLRRRLLDLLEPIYGPLARPALSTILFLVQSTSDPLGQLAKDPCRAVGGREAADLAGVSPKPAEILAVSEKLQPSLIELFKIISEREKFIERMCAILIPETVEQHWRVTGREALSGMIGFEFGRWEHDPEGHGDPNFAKILDWLNGATPDGGGFSDPDVAPPSTSPDGEHRPGGYNGQGNVGGGPADATGGDAENGDLTEKMLDDAIRECRINGYSARVINDLSSLRRKPDRERGSVISTAGGSINIFKNAAVRQRTSRSTFRMTDLRGVFAPDGRILPVTLYIDVPLQDAEALGRVTGLFVDNSAALLLSLQPEEADTRKKNGTIRPVLYLLDEFWTMPPLAQLRNIPALGRGLWVQALIVGQSYLQIASKYGAQGNNAVEELKASTHYKIAPALNDAKSSDDVSKTIGNRTVFQTSTSQQKGFGKGVNPFSHNESTSLIGVPLIRPDEIRRLEKLDSKKEQWGWQIVTFGSEVVMCRPAAYFDIPELRKRTGVMKPADDWGRALLRPPSEDAPTAAPASLQTASGLASPPPERRAA